MERDQVMASEAMRGRVADLVRRENAGDLSADEAAELDGYLDVEHRMRLARARTASAEAER
ncbi:hypothetical protein [Longimicrobium sp.]|uniref:hypothetical protein n=1 Tax=Longimicrobium sp. TaxID=2029185 RepID=UPI002E2FB1E8|nr:hypothetical protein [Longimicrobium sp.]HEX6038152.1 hypothetical protein [Longimicrobium sp.]